MRINRNIVECKFECIGINPYNFSELIETLWNVNTFIQLSSTVAPKELIETLWNVNVFDQ